MTALLTLWVLFGAVGIARCWRAVRDGWSPAPKRLVGAALLATMAFAVVPPVTSDDVVSYAAYGRMVVLRYDPYRTTPAELAAIGDPIGAEVGEPWDDSPSIYGPVATGEHAALMWLAGDSLRTGVALLTLAGALVFGATVLCVDRLAGDAGRRRRAVLLLGLNPLVVVSLVAGAHVDTLLLLGVAAALLALRRHPVLAGALAGGAVSVKLTGALALLGIAWSIRQDMRRIAALALGVGLVMVPAYLAAGGWRALQQARTASRFVSVATPWRPLRSGLQQVIPDHTARSLVPALSLVAVAGLVWLLARALPAGDATPRAVLVLSLAWVLGATYVLPWYDSLAWLPLALVPVWSGWDRLLLWHTAVLAFVYLPGRNIGLDPVLAEVMDVARTGVAPAVLAVLLVLVVRLAFRGGGRWRTTEQH